MEVNEVPRRLIIHFFHEFNEEDIKELNNDITVTPTYENIFIKGDKNRQLRSNHQKGHVNKDGVYIKHTEMKGKRKAKPTKGDKPMGRRPLDPNTRMPNRGNPTRPHDFSLANLNINRQAPKLTPGATGGVPFRPPNVGGGNMTGLPQPGGFRPPFVGQPPAFGANLPPNMPPSNLPPGMGRPPNFPNSMVPPAPITSGLQPNRPMTSGPTLPGSMPGPMGSMPPMGGMPVMGGMPSPFPPTGFGPGQMKQPPPPPQPPKTE